MLQITALPAAADRNPGIVPPWLVSEAPTKNPGIVPPWLADPIRILPVDEDSDEPIFTILPIDGDTEFVPEPVDVTPTSLADAVRGR